MSRNHYHDGSYPGGKGGAGTYQKLINRIPPHDTFISAFLGNCAVMRYKKPARVNIGIDSDPAVLASFDDALRSGSLILGQPPETQNHEASNGNSHGGNGDMAGNTGNHGEAGPGNAKPGNAKPGNAQSQVKFVCSDAVTWLENFRHTLRADTFIYADPPYLRDTRKQQGDLYAHEFDTPAQHTRLLTCLKSLPCPVMISGYWSELYDRELRGWNCFSFEVMTRGGTKATEWVWMNYPEPTALHDYRYLGEDYRERERIKKKKRRWVNRLRKLDRLERQALLSVIEEEFSDVFSSIDTPNGNGQQPCQCGCGRMPVWKGNGRPPKFFSDACKQRYWRETQKEKKRYETVTKHPDEIFDRPLEIEG